MSFVSIAAGVGAAGGLLKMGMGLHQNHLANKIQVPDATYQTSPYAQRMMGQAQMLLNSRQPGMTAATNNIMGAQSNAMASAQRNATSGSQALSMLNGAQANTDNAFGGLAQQEGQWKLNALNNYNQASNSMINEGDKVYQSDLQKRLEAINQKTALRGAGAQNFGGGVNDLANNAFLANMAGLGGNRTPPIGGMVNLPPMNYDPSMVSSTGYINPNNY